ncbi:hypothetical protein ACHAWX_006376 [Stephanocyclus meneghinianus]
MPSPSHKQSSSSGGGGGGSSGFSLLSSLKHTSSSNAGNDSGSAAASSRPPSSPALANASTAVPLRTTRSFNSYQQQMNKQAMQQQRRRANYRAAPPSPKPYQQQQQQQQVQQQQPRRFPLSPSSSYDHDDSTQASNSVVTDSNLTSSPGKRSVISGGGGIFKASSFDDFYYNNSEGYHDAFALLGQQAANASAGGNSNDIATEASGVVPSSPSRRKRFFPSTPKKMPHNNGGTRSPAPGADGGVRSEEVGSIPPSNLFMPSFNNNNNGNNSTSSNSAVTSQPPIPTTALRSSSPSIRSSSPLSLRMKQSLPWAKSKNSTTANNRHGAKGSGHYSDAVAMALREATNEIESNVLMEQMETNSQAGMEVVNPFFGVSKEGEKEKMRFRTRSPSPIRYLAHNSSTRCTLGLNESKDDSEFSHSRNRLHLHAKNDDEQSNAPSSAAPSFFHNRNIRTMSPARLKMNLKKKILQRIPSSPRRNSDSETGLEEYVEDDEGMDAVAEKFAAASMSFELEDDYELNHSDGNADSISERNSPTPDTGDFIINTASFNIFENSQFLHAMGGTNDASLATNYIRTGDALCSTEEGQYDRALPLYYAGLGAILSRIRQWSLDRRHSKDRNWNADHAGDEHQNLVYQDFSTVARSPEMNVLLLAMASILLRAGNAHYSLGRFETSCRDYVSAQSYRSLRQRAVHGEKEDFILPSLVDTDPEEQNLLLEDAKLNGRISNNMACAQTKRRMYEEARVGYTKALQIKQKTLEGVHDMLSALGNGSSKATATPHPKEVKDDDLVSDIATTFHNIGLLRVSCDEPKKAEKAFKQSLSLRVKKFGLDDLGVSSTLCALGDVYFHQKRHDDAFRSYKESLRIWKFHRGTDERTAELYMNIGLVFYSKGPYSKAKMSVTECLRIRREQCGVDSLPVASALYLLGLISTAIGDHHDALCQLEEALAIRQRLLGNKSPNHLLIFNVHLAIGKVHSLMGDFDKSLKSFSTVLLGRTMRLGKHHESVAEVLHAIGVAYIAANEYSKAVETLEEALRLRRSLLGPSMEVAETLDSLSTVCFCCEDTEHAIELSEESLKILKGAVGFDHFLVAQALKNSGDYKQNFGALDDSIEDYTESLRVMTAWQGRDHISLSELLNEIGVTYFKKEEYVLAKESFAEALRIMRLSADRADKSVIFPTLSHLGHALYKNKELDVAAATYLESFKIQVSIVTGDECKGLEDFGKNFSAFKDEIISIGKEEEDVASISEALGGIASILRYLGLVNHAQGDFESALTANKLSLSVRLCQPFREHSAIALMAETIAMFEFKRNNLKSALEYFSQALESKKTFQGESTIDVARTVNNLANIHFSLGNLEDAMKLYHEALEIKRHCLGEDSDEVANTLNNIAHVMVTAGKEHDALKAYHNVLRIRQEKYGKNHISVAATLASMGDVYIKLGKLEIAMTYLEQCLRIRKLQNESCDERLMENLASIYGQLGEWKKAEAAFTEILCFKRASYGSDCLDVAKTLDLLAVSYIEQDRHNESIEHLKEALRIRKVCLGGDDDEILASLNKLAFVYKCCNMTEKMLDVKAEFDDIQARRKG